MQLSFLILGATAKTIPDSKEFWIFIDPDKSPDCDPLCFQEDSISLNCITAAAREGGSGERMCLAAEGFGNRMCFLQSMANKVRQPWEWT